MKGAGEGEGEGGGEGDGEGGGAGEGEGEEGASRDLMDEALEHVSGTSFRDVYPTVSELASV